MLAEYDENSSLTTLYTRGEELISQERNGEKSYYLYDGFDSVRMLADEDNNITDTYTFDAFGNLTASTGDTENSYLYRGEQYDSFTGLYYLRARYMNPSTGTFITMDEYAGSVFEPVSLHKYLYANANPVTYCDPTGYFSMPECLAVVGIKNVLNSMACGACMGAMIGGMYSMLITVLRGGTSAEIQQAFLDGMANGFISGAMFGGLGAFASVYWQAELIRSMCMFMGGYNAVQAAMLDFANGDYLAGILNLGIGLSCAYSSANSASRVRGMRQGIFSYTSSSSHTQGQSNDGIDRQRVIDTASQPKRGGETLAGHALQKHSGRNPEIWGAVKGGPEQINQTAMNHINEIMDAPGNFQLHTNNNGVRFWEKVLPDGRGLRLNMDGSFKGFIIGDYKK